MTLRRVQRRSSASTVLLPRRSVLATAPHWFLYYCSSHDDISHFVSSAFFLPLISIADYSASVGSDLMREPTELLLPSFAVIALCSPPVGPAQAARRAANNIDRGGDRHFDTSAKGSDWQRAIQPRLDPCKTHTYTQTWHNVQHICTLTMFLYWIHSSMHSSNFHHVGF